LTGKYDKHTKVEVHAPHGFLVGDAVQMGNLHPRGTECVKLLSGVHRIVAMMDKTSFIVKVDISSCKGEVRASDDLEWPSRAVGQTAPFHVCRYKAGKTMRGDSKHGPVANYGKCGTFAKKGTRVGYYVDNVPVVVKSKEICSKEVASRASKTRPADTNRIIKGTMVFRFEATPTTTTTSTTTKKPKGWVVVSTSRRRRSRDPNYVMKSYLTTAFKELLKYRLGTNKAITSREFPVTVIAVKAPQHGDTWSVDFSFRTHTTWEKTVPKALAEVQSIKLEDFNTQLQIISKKRRYAIPGVASMKFSWQ